MPVRVLTALVIAIALGGPSPTRAQPVASPSEATSGVAGEAPSGAPDQVTGEAPNQDQELVAYAFFQLLVGHQPSDLVVAMRTIEANWSESIIPMALETVYLSRNPVGATNLIQLLQTKTGQAFGYEIAEWQRWLWNREVEMHPAYPLFKAMIYSLVDPKLGAYFHQDYPSTIRLDEIVWGGVTQDGIPPLREPAMITAEKTTYLDDTDVVFGVSVNGDVRAYPRRILAWHEMFIDEVGGMPVAGVYCTLCGAVILYHTTVNGVNHEMGTSGFLYRSNKLMYDRATQSLWSTMWGTPVLGPLVGQGIALARMSVVTTTWGEWRRRYPGTTVLSIETGHERDYSEGAAYREYFAVDALMFPVPKLDDRLANKAEVLALVALDAEPLAISADYLADHPVWQGALGDRQLVVLTDKSGANRVYDRGTIDFASWDQDAAALDHQGDTWQVSEDGLQALDGRKLGRVPAHRAFWFGWYAAYPHTRLIR